MLTFIPFDNRTAEFIRPWFNDSETKKWLGGDAWVDTELEQQKKSIGAVFRGAKTLARYGWVVFRDGEPVGYIDAAVSDKYVKYGGVINNKQVYLKIDEKLTAGIVFLVNPNERGRGIATQMIGELIKRPELLNVHIFEAGVEPNNIGSIKALEKAGFKGDYIKDFEGMYYFLLRK